MVRGRSLLFNSFTFACLLLPVLGAYWLAPSQRLRLWILLTGSLIFYGWRHWPSLIVLLATIGINYLLGRLLERRPRPAWLALGVALNLASLAWFKYASFLLSSLKQAFAWLGAALPLSPPSPWLPLGISFFTFQVIAYLVDVYRGRIAAERSLLVFAVFKSFFAQLIAGPIVRAEEMLPQLRSRRPFDATLFHRGLFCFLGGLFLKMAVADVLGQFADQAFLRLDQQATLEAWLGLYAYAVQLFADFWGYSTMAVGLGLMFGITLPVNFAVPYHSTSLQEFWRRWHITLSNWFRDYLYIPLGGNRRRGALNLLIVMALAGLWHGAGWNFVLWGTLHGLWLAIERAWSRGPLPSLRLPRAVQALLVFQGVCLLWVLFRAPSLPSALAYYRRLLLPPYTSASAVPGLLVAGLAAFALLHAGLYRLLDGERFVALKLRWQVALSAAMILTVLAYGEARLDFIYFVF